MTHNVGHNARIDRLYNRDPGLIHAPCLLVTTYGNMRHGGTQTLCHVTADR